MYIQVRGFRSIENFECEFEKDSITLVSGASGSGKSTLMNAIFWCIFGTLRNVRKFGLNTGTCSVKIIFDDGFIVERSKSPELFTLNYRDVVFRNKEAQDKIIELFGNQDKWLSCCYLKQGSRNHFLESSSAERLQIITDICFHKESPNDYIQKIDKKIEETKNAFEIKNQALIRDLDILNLKIKDAKKRYNISNINNLILSEKERENLVLKIESFKSLNQLEKRYEDSWQTLKKKELISGILKERILKFPNYRDYIPMFGSKNTHKDIDVRNLSSEISNVESKIKKIESLTQKVQAQRSALDQISGRDFTSFDPRDLEECEIRLNEKIKLSPLIQEKRVLENQRNKLKEEIQDHNTTELQSQIDRAKEVVRLREEYQRLRKIIGEKWDSISERNISEEEEKESLINDKIRNKHVLVLKKLGLDDGCNIANEIEKRKFDIQAYKLKTTKEKIRAINQQLSKLEKTNNVWISEEEIPAKTLEHKMILDGVSCPNCNCLLMYDSSLNKIMLVSGDISTQHAYKLKNLIEESKIRNDLIRQDRILEEELLSLGNIPYEIDIDEDKVYEEIRLLENIPRLSTHETYQDLFLAKTKWRAIQIENLIYQNKDVDDDEVNKLLQMKTKIEIYESICTEIEKIDKQIGDTEDFCIEDTMKQLSECREIQKFIVYSKKLESEMGGKTVENLMEYLDCLIQKRELENIRRSKEIVRLEEEFNTESEDPKQIKDLIEKDREQRIEWKTKIDTSDEMIKLLNEKKKLVELREEVVQLEKKIIGFSKIKMIAKELEHKRIISTLQTIGDFSNDILCSLFDEPIKIDFDVFKTTKTSKTTKPIINYRILYKGHEIDSIDQLSGGEADRVSLAVSCALFKFSDFPFLILDEFASSLDLNNKENAVSSLKAFLGDVESKSIICISHDTVEGMYDYHFRF
jgi:DNA repair exonuclease SbcCD ATPase subunit